MSDWAARASSADDAISTATSGMRVFVHGAAATPTPLLEALVASAQLRDVTLYRIYSGIGGQMDCVRGAALSCRAPRPPDRTCSFGSPPSLI